MRDIIQSQPAETEPRPNTLMLDLAQVLEDVFNEPPERSVGFCLVMFDLDTPTVTHYASNAEPETLAQALDDVAQQLPPAAD